MADPLLPLLPPPAPRRFDLRRAEYAIVGTVLVFAGGFALAAALVGGERVLTHLRELGLPTVLSLLGLALVNYTLRATRWLIYSRRIGVDVPVSANLTYYFAGFSLTATPGKVGETLRHWLLQRGHGYAYARTLPLWVADRLNDVTATLVLILGGLAAFANLVWAVLGFTVLFTAFIALVTKPTILLAVVGWIYARVRRRHRLFAGMRRAIRLSSRLFTPRLYLLGVSLAVAGWFAECVAFHLLLAEMGSPIGLEQAVFVFAFSLLAGGASMMPGGIGGFEATMVALLLALDVGPDVAVAATAVIRATTLWFCVGLGFATLPFALARARRARPRTKRKVSPPSHRGTEEK